MRGNRTTILRFISPVVLLGLVPWCSKVAAGPARYDSETKSFKFTYTYAALTEGAFGDAAIGAPQKATTEQDAMVRTIMLKVSDALSKATAGRIRIASLDLVPEVKRADVVISLTGQPAAEVGLSRGPSRAGPARSGSITRPSPVSGNRTSC